MTTKNKRVNLDTIQLSNTITKLKSFKDMQPKLVDSIAKESAKQGKEYAENLFQAYRPDKTIDTSTISVDVKKTPLGYNIVASGKDVLYAEFGTGDKGSADPHPVKDIVGLNDYNSGPTIKTTKDGRHYWRYEYAPKQYVTSHGNPSGKQMWQTIEELRKNIIPQIIKEKVGEAISNL